ncbi:hypothetical protein I4U23_003914 [Adineta vaga]|nr:hypothetical protein I4U23_003914 [Adineta vaga]
MENSLSQMDRVQTLPEDIHIQILKEGLSKLEMYKRRLNERIAQNNKDEEEKTV